MKNNHPLYLIIKSMTATEKAYFKKFAFKQQAKSNESFKRIFDIIDKQKKYNIDQLITDKKIDVTFKKNIYFNLNALNKRILSSLLDYRKGNTNLTKLFELFLEYELLKEKKLYTLADKKIKKAEELAQKRNFYFLKPQITYWQYEFLRGNTLLNKKDLKTKIKELKSHLKEINLVSKHEFISFELELIIHENQGLVIKSEKDQVLLFSLIKKIKKILKSGLLNVQIKSVLLTNLFVMNIMLGNIEKLKKFSKTYIQFFKEDILPKKSNAIKCDALVGIKNLAVVHTYFNQNKQYDRCLKLYKNTTKLITDAKRISILKNNILYLEILHSAFHTNIELDKKVLLKAYELIKIQDINSLHYFELLMPLLMVLIQKKQFQKALDISSEILNIKFNNRIRDSFLSIRMLRAIAWLKLENLQMFDFEINAVYQFLLKNESFYFNILILNFIKKLTKTTVFKNKYKLLKNVIIEFKKIQKNGIGTEMMKAIELKTILELGL